MNPEHRTPAKTRFESTLQVRPDDIDMNQHVHASRYSDYVLAARYDQMARCYQLPLEEFIKRGYAWFTKVSHFEYRRPLRLGDQFTVRTWVEKLQDEIVQVRFEIVKLPTGKLCCDGYCEYAFVNAASGRAEDIPPWVMEKYCV